MIDRSQRKSEDCLELRLQTLVSSFLMCGGTVVTCMAYVVGGHAAFWLLPSELDRNQLGHLVFPSFNFGLARMDWQVGEAHLAQGSVLTNSIVLGLVLALFWLGFWRLVLALNLTRSNGLFRNFLSIVNTTLWFGPNYRRFVRTVGTVLTVIILVVPSWLALIGWSVILLTLILYPKVSRVIWLAVTLCGISGLAALAGLLQTRFLPETLSFSLLHWIGPAWGGIVLTLAVSIGIRWAASGQGTWYWLIPALFPLSAGLTAPYLADWGQPPTLSSYAVFFAVGCVIWPAMIAFLAFLRHSGAKRELCAFLESDVSHFRQRISVHVTGEQPYEVIEGDGYASLLRIRYYNRCPQAGTGFWGDRGYICLLELDPEVVPCPSVAFRVTSLSKASFLDEQDRLGLMIGNLVKSLVPKLGVEGVVTAPIEAVEKAWSVKRLTHEPAYIAKLPWDHPDLFLLPESRLLKFTFPDGTGIHDCNDYRVSVVVKLKIEINNAILDSIDRLNGDNHQPQKEDELDAVRKLFHNLWRIMPAAYETTLLGLVKHCRNDSFVPVDGNHVPPAEGNERLGKRVETHIKDSLPPEIAALVTISVMEVSPRVVRRAAEIVEARARLEQSNASEAEKALQIIEDFRQRYAKLIHGDHIAARSDPNAPSPASPDQQVQGDLVRRITKIQTEFSKALPDAADSIFSQMKNSTDDVATRILASVDQELRTRLATLSGEMDVALSELNEKAKDLTI